MERPNKKDYDFNDVFEGVRFASNMIKYVDYLEKQLSIHVVVDTLPNIDSAEFQNWLLDGGYTETKTPKLYKKGCGYFEQRNLYRHYQNILTFGN